MISEVNDAAEIKSRQQGDHMVQWNVSLLVARAFNLSPRVHACAVSFQNSATSFACAKSCCALFHESDRFSLQLHVPPADVLSSLSVCAPEHPRTGGSCVLALSLIGLCCHCSAACTPGSCPSVSERTLGSLHLSLHDCFAALEQTVIVQVGESAPNGNVEFRVLATPALPGFYGVTRPADKPCLLDARHYLDSAALMIKSLDCMSQKPGLSERCMSSGYRTACLGLHATVETLSWALKQQRLAFSSILAGIKQQNMHSTILRRILFAWSARSASTSIEIRRHSLIVAKGNRLCLLFAFGRWAGFARRSRRLKQLGVLGCFRARFSAVKAFFKTWQHCVTLQMTLKNLKCKGVLVLDNTIKRHDTLQKEIALQAWINFTARSKSDRIRAATDVLHSIQTVASEENRFDRSLMRSQLRMRKKSFGHWMQRVHATRRLRAVSAKVVRRLLQRMKSTFLALWMQRVHATRRLRAVSAKAVRRLLQRGMSRAFSSWNAHLSLMMIQREMMNRAIQRIVRPAIVSGAFSGWKDVCMASYESRQQEAEFALSLISAVEREARRTSRNELTAERRAKRQDFRMKSTFLALWMQRVHATRRLRAVSAKAVRRLLQRGMSRAFSSWNAHLILMKQQRELDVSQQAVHHLTVKSVVSSYKGRISREIIVGNLHGWKCSVSLQFCFRFWISIVQKIKKTRALLQKQEVRTVSVAFELWCDRHQFTRWKHSVMVSFFHRVVSLRVLFRAFFCWNTQVSGQNFLRSILGARRSIINKSIKFLQSLWQRRASALVDFGFVSWKSMVGKRRSFKNVVCVMEQRASRFIVLTHFCAWRIVRMKLACERADVGQVIPFSRCCAFVCMMCLFGALLTLCFRVKSAILNSGCKRWTKRWRLCALR
jgi:hypothetical protein